MGRPNRYNSLHVLLLRMWLLVAVDTSASGKATQAGPTSMGSRLFASLIGATRATSVSGIESPDHPHTPSCYNCLFGLVWAIGRALGAVFGSSRKL